MEEQVHRKKKLRKKKTSAPRTERNREVKNERRSSQYVRERERGRNIKKKETKKQGKGEGRCEEYDGGYLLHLAREGGRGGRQGL